MPFLMIRNDITKVAADAIVNPANRNLLQGSGTSRAIYQAAGEQELTASCEAIGRCDLGRAVWTPAFGLPAKYIFHTLLFATVYKGNIIKNLIMDCQSYTKYRPNETTGGIFVSWRRKEELPTGA